MGPRSYQSHHRAHALEPPLPNTLAYLALFSWPAVCLILFAWLPLEAAAIASLLGGYLLLPSGMTVDIKVLPPLDKLAISSITAFLLCWAKGTKSPAPKPSVLIYCLALAFILSPVFTSFQNSYELQVGGRSLPGLYLGDSLKLAFQNVLTLIPFFLGMRFFSSDDGRALLLKSLPIAAVLYSPLMLFEIRFSPQLHTWVYGFFPHSFLQQVRDGGYRPVVFLGHGLEVALFTSLAFIAAVIGARAKWHILRAPAGAVAGFLGVMLVLCKSLGSMIYAVIAVPLVLFTAPKTWVRIACAIALVVCAYPMLRTLDLVPVKQFAMATNRFSADRGSSFQMRVDNEEALLAKANQKPLVGWGSWGRNRVYTETGADSSTTDGQWIIVFGMYGWLGYLSLFGLFAAALMRARTAVRGRVDQASIVVGGMSLLLAVNLIDLIPNAGLRPFTYLMAGSIAGCVRARSTRQAARRNVAASQAAFAAPR